MPDTNRFTEDSFINFLTANFPEIGDDCAVVEISPQHSLLLTTDALVEDTHFRLSSASPEDLGFKSIAVNLSDIAAMGSSAKYVLLTLGLPPDIENSWVEEFMAGVKEILDRYEVKLIGGDTVKSEKGIFINVTAIGQALTERIKYRSDAKPGDLICVSKTLGDSYLGFLALEKGLNLPEAIERHRRPLPELELAKILGEMPEVHAMMDLSDGLQKDLPRLAAASGCRLEIDVERLPLAAAAEKMNVDPVEAAVSGGEDYALLFTVAAGTELPPQVFDIGRVTAGTGVVYLKNQQELEIRTQPFEHF